MQGSSTLFAHATIITVDEQRRIIIDGAILVEQDRIMAVDKTEKILNLTRLPENTAVVDCTDTIIIPGLINTHAHLAQSLLRGLAEDVPLHSWLCDAVWPLEAQFEPGDGYVGARLTIAEMLKSGTTCFLEAMLTHRAGFADVARAVDEMGIRACLGKLVKVEETNRDIGLVDPRDRDVSSMSIDSALSTYDLYNNSCNGRLQVWMAASTPRGSPAAMHKAIGDACGAHKIGLTMHCAEAPKDLDIFRQSYDCTPAEFCVNNNLIGKGRNTVLAHMVNLDLVIDLPLLHDHEANVAHNPASNCKLASGIAPIPQMVEEQINVALGTDGAPCNNTYDMLQEMRLAGLIHKGTTCDASVLPAEQILDMATIHGARALGLERDIGSIEVGKKADLVIIRADGLHCAPYSTLQVVDGGFDPITAVVYSCTGADVDTVVVNGRVVVRNRQLLVADEAQIRHQARACIGRIRDASGVTAQKMRNYI